MAPGKWLSLGVFTLGLVIGATGTLSYLRTNWNSYHIDLFFWWSIVSTLIGCILVCFSIWQYLEAKGEKKRSKDQVKIWMQNADGIVKALGKLIDGKPSTISDACNAAGIVEESASALYRSLYEERYVDEEDSKAREKLLSDIITDQQVKDLKSKASKTQPNSIK